MEEIENIKELKLLINDHRVHKFGTEIREYYQKRLQQGLFMEA